MIKRETYRKLQTKAQDSKGASRYKIQLSNMLTRQWPIYIPSFNRANNLTTRELDRWGIQHATVWKANDPTEVKYEPKASHLRIEVDDNTLSSVKQRNAALDHAEENGNRYAWILDDNIRTFRLLSANRKIHVGGDAFALVEKMIDKLGNVAIGGMEYTHHLRPHVVKPVFAANRLIYSAMLVRTDYRFEGLYNEDVDICLRAMINGHGTFRTNCVNADKVPTGRAKGGNEKLYSGLGHIRKTVALRRKYPDLVNIVQKYGRYAHQCKWDKVPDPEITENGKVEDVFFNYMESAIVRNR